MLFWSKMQLPATSLQLPGQGSHRCDRVGVGVFLTGRLSQCEVVQDLAIDAQLTWLSNCTRVGPFGLVAPRRIGGKREGT